MNSTDDPLVEEKVHAVSEVDEHNSSGLKDHSSLSVESLKFAIFEEAARNQPLDSTPQKSRIPAASFTNEEDETETEAAIRVKEEIILTFLSMSETDRNQGISLHEIYERLPIGTNVSFSEFGYQLNHDPQHRFVVIDDVVYLLEHRVRSQRLIDSSERTGDEIDISEPLPSTYGTVFVTKSQFPSEGILFDNNQDNQNVPVFHRADHELKLANQYFKSMRRHIRRGGIPLSNLMKTLLVRSSEETFMKLLENDELRRFKIINGNVFWSEGKLKPPTDDLDLDALYRDLMFLELMNFPQDRIAFKDLYKLVRKQQSERKCLPRLQESVCNDNRFLVSGGNKGEKLYVQCNTLLLWLSERNEEIDQEEYLIHNSSSDTDNTLAQDTADSQKLIAAVEQIDEDTTVNPEKKDGESIIESEEDSSAKQYDPEPMPLSSTVLIPSENDVSVVPITNLVGKLKSALGLPARKLKPRKKTFKTPVNLHNERILINFDNAASSSGVSEERRVDHIEWTPNIFARTTEEYKVPQNIRPSGSVEQLGDGSNSLHTTIPTLKKEEINKDRNDYEISFDSYNRRVVPIDHTNKSSVSRFPKPDYVNNYSNVPFHMENPFSISPLVETLRSADLHQHKDTENVQRISKTKDEINHKHECFPLPQSLSSDDDSSEMNERQTIINLDFGRTKETLHDLIFGYLSTIPEFVRNKGVSQKIIHNAIPQLSGLTEKEVKRLLKFECRRQFVYVTGLVYIRPHYAIYSTDKEYYRDVVYLFLLKKGIIRNVNKCRNFLKKYVSAPNMPLITDLGVVLSSDSCNRFYVETIKPGVEHVSLRSANGRVPLQLPFASYERPIMELPAPQIPFIQDNMIFQRRPDAFTIRTGNSTNCSEQTDSMLPLTNNDITFQQNHSTLPMSAVFDRLPFAADSSLQTQTMIKKQEKLQFKQSTSRDDDSSDESVTKTTENSERRHFTWNVEALHGIIFGYLSKLSGLVQNKGVSQKTIHNAIPQLSEFSEKELKRLLECECRRQFVYVSGLIYIRPHYAISSTDEEYYRDVVYYFLVRKGSTVTLDDCRRFLMKSVLTPNMFVLAVLSAVLSTDNRNRFFVEKIKPGVEHVSLRLMHEHIPLQLQSLCTTLPSTESTSDYIRTIHDKTFEMLLSVATGKSREESITIAQLKKGLPILSVWTSNAISRVMRSDKLRRFIHANGKIYLRPNYQTSSEEEYYRDVLYYDLVQKVVTPRSLEMCLETLVKTEKLDFNHQLLTGLHHSVCKDTRFILRVLNGANLVLLSGISEFFMTKNRSIGITMDGADRAHKLDIPATVEAIVNPKGMNNANIDEGDAAVVSLESGIARVNETHKSFPLQQSTSNDSVSCDKMIDNPQKSYFAQSIETLHSLIFGYLSTLSESIRTKGVSQTVIHSVIPQLSDLTEKAVTWLLKCECRRQFVYVSGLVYIRPHYRIASIDKEYYRDLVYFFLLQSGGARTLDKCRTFVRNSVSAPNGSLLAELATVLSTDSCNRFSVETIQPEVEHVSLRAAQEHVSFRKIHEAVETELTPPQIQAIHDFLLSVLEKKSSEEGITLIELKAKLPAVSLWKTEQIKKIVKLDKLRRFIQANSKVHLRANYKSSSDEDYYRDVIYFQLLKRPNKPMLLNTCLGILVNSEKGDVNHQLINAVRHSFCNDKRFMLTGTRGATTVQIISGKSDLNMQKANNLDTNKLHKEKKADDWQIVRGKEQKKAVILPEKVSLKTQDKIRTDGNAGVVVPAESNGILHPPVTSFDLPVDDLLQKLKSVLTLSKNSSESLPVLSDAKTCKETKKEDKSSLAPSFLDQYRNIRKENAWPLFVSEALGLAVTDLRLPVFGQIIHENYDEEFINFENMKPREPLYFNTAIEHCRSFRALFLDDKANTINVPFYKLFHCFEQRSSVRSSFLVVDDNPLQFLQEYSLLFPFHYDRNDVEVLISPYCFHQKECDYSKYCGQVRPLLIPWHLLVSSSLPEKLIELLNLLQSDHDLYDLLSFVSKRTSDLQSYDNFLEVIATENIHLSKRVREVLDLVVLESAFNREKFPDENQKFKENPEEFELFSTERKLHMMDLGGSIHGLQLAEADLQGIYSFLINSFIQPQHVTEESEKGIIFRNITFESSYSAIPPSATPTLPVETTTKGIISLSRVHSLLRRNDLMIFMQQQEHSQIMQSPSSTSQPFLSPSWIEFWDCIFLSSAIANSAEIKNCLAGSGVSKSSSSTSCQELSRIVSSFPAGDRLMYFPQGRKYHSTKQPLNWGLNSADLKNFYHLTWEEG
jgi:hypothetical protein